jgi:hypothetical protein
MSSRRFPKIQSSGPLAKNYQKECCSIRRELSRVFTNLGLFKILGLKYLHIKLMGLEIIEFMMILICPAY